MEDNFNLNTDKDILTALNALETEEGKNPTTQKIETPQTEQEQQRTVYLTIAAVVIMVGISLFLFLQPKQKTIELTPAMIEQMQSSAAQQSL